MDSLTHIALGSCIGVVTLGKKWRLPAIGWGLAAASLPDIDAVAGLFLSLPEELIAHRGITHSFLFAFLVPLLLAGICVRRYSNRKISYIHFYLFFLLQILLHDLLDTCNAYGTGLLEPFSTERFSVHLLYVADPLFTLWPVIAMVMILVKRGRYQSQFRFATVALGITSAYLAISITNKLIARNYLEKSIQEQGLPVSEYFITPTPFNTLLWYGVAKSDSGYHIGHLSVFDDKNKFVPLTRFDQKAWLITQLPPDKDVERLKQFADGYYTVEQWNDTLVLNVLRFGQMIGWQEPKAHFAFHYYLNPGYDNNLVVQRGRFEGWNKLTLQYMINRMKGSLTAHETDGHKILKPAVNRLQ